MIGRHPFPLLFVAPACFLLVAVDGARAQEPRFVLRDIIHAPYTRGSARPPDVIELQANEGFVEFTVDYSGNCRERYRFEYSFDQDMNALPFDSEYGFRATMRSLEGRCQQARDPFVTGTSSNGGFSGVLNAMAGDPAFEYGRLVKLLGGGMPRLYAYGVSRNAIVGTNSGAFSSRRVNLNYDGAHSWLGFSIQASSNTGEADTGFYYDIIFIYQQVNDYVAPPIAGCPSPPDCSDLPGTIPVWNFDAQKAECWCPEGTAWDRVAARCVAP